MHPGTPAQILSHSGNAAPAEFTETWEARTGFCQTRNATQQNSGGGGIAAVILARRVPRRRGLF